jgi:hypothetical protein
MSPPKKPSEKVTDVKEASLGEMERQQAFYAQALQTLMASSIPFLIGGAFALRVYTGIKRDTKDLDVFVHPRDFDRVQDLFASVGFETEVRFPHWLGKAYSGEHFVDIIYSSGNGICSVDELWFKYATSTTMFGLKVQICPPEEMIWSKAYIMERERYDGADVAHLILARGDRFDWVRLLERFDTHWRVLLSHLVLFGFVYPADRNRVPKWVLHELLGRLQQELSMPPPTERICQGTLLSWCQYLPKVEAEGYEDGRHWPHGTLSAEETAQVTETFQKEKEAEE